MIDDCIQLSVEARVIRAYVDNTNRGVVLAWHQRQFVVWKVFRPKKSITWNCRDGQYTTQRNQADVWFVDILDELLPPVSCKECGYYFSDLEEGCDACAFLKWRNPVVV